MRVDEKAISQLVAPIEPISEPLTPLTPDAAVDEDDNPDAIFVRAVAEIPTQPLNRDFTPRWELDRQIERECALALFLFLFLLLATVIIRIINQPVITVTLVPVHKSVTITTPITIQTRTLAPVTITRTLTTPTTGHGHQDAKAATGTLTFYNAAFTPQTVDAGTIFTGSDGAQVETLTPVTIAANNPPSDGVAQVSAQAVSKGANGNIPSLAINTAVTSSLFVKNLAAFTGGQNARDFQAVARSDLDSLTAKLQQILTKDIPQAFTLNPGEALHTAACILKTSANYQAGDEARTVTMTASQTCSAIVYNKAELERKATIIFNATQPRRQFELVNGVRITILSIAPFTVRVSGQWEYAITPDDEQDLAQQIQGETPAEARAYLFKTGLVSRITMTQTQTLPDLYHIKFLILIGV